MRQVCDRFVVSSALMADAHIQGARTMHSRWSHIECGKYRQIALKMAHTCMYRYIIPPNFRLVVKLVQAWGLNSIYTTVLLSAVIEKCVLRSRCSQSAYMTSSKINFLHIMFMHTCVFELCVCVCVCVRERA